jgi:hypothetical protein
VSNAETIVDLAKVKRTFLRSALDIMLQHHDAETVVETLAEALSDGAHQAARRSGDYERAARMNLVAQHLEGLDAFIDNFDPTRD